MTSFAQSQAVFSYHSSSSKLRKNLSIETSSSTKRGLSLVSSKDAHSSTPSKKNSCLKDSTKPTSKGAVFKFFQCSVPTCDMKYLAEN